MRTIKNAKQEELRTREQWLSSYHRCPKVDALGEMIKGKVYFSKEETEQTFSKTDGRKNGLRLNPDAEPVHRVHCRKAGRYYELYRASNFSPARPRSIQPPVSIDLLTAIFTVNRSAKRYRDAASALHSNSLHPLSGASSKKKKRLYALKDAGIREAYRRKLLWPTAIHGGLAVYRGSGFCFHSSQVPVELQGELPREADAEVFFRESVPKSSAEAKLKDAEFTLLKCDCSTDGFVTLEVPRIRPPELHASDVNRDSVHDFDDDDPDDFDF